MKQDKKAEYRARIARAQSVPTTVADAEAFERAMLRLGDSELRGFLLVCNQYALSQLDNLARKKPTPAGVA